MVGVEEEEDEAAGAPRGIDSPSSFVGDGGGGTHVRHRLGHRRPRPHARLVHGPEELGDAPARQVVRVHVVVGRDPRPRDHEAELDHEPEELAQQVVQPVRPRPPLLARLHKGGVVDEERHHAPAPLMGQPLDARHHRVALEEVDGVARGARAVLEVVVRAARADPAAARVPRLLGRVRPHRRRRPEVGIRVVPPPEVGR